AKMERRYHTVIPLGVASIAFVLLARWGAGSPFLSVLLWCAVAAGIYSVFGPFWSLPSRFLTGASAAAGIAFINSLGNVGGFVGPYVVGAVIKRTGGPQGGLVFAAAALLVSAVLILMFRDERN